MPQGSAHLFLVAAVALVQSLASQPKGDQSIAIAAVTEARDELKLVVQQLGEQQDQIDELTKEVAELRAAKKAPTVTPKTNASATAGQNEGSSNKTTVTRKALASLRATAERAEHVLVAERPRTPWWAEKQHTKGPDRMHREGGYFGESNTDATFGRQRYYPAGWRIAPEHQPIPSVPIADSTNGFTSYNVFAPDMVAAPPAPSPLDEAVPTLAPILEDTPLPVETPPSAAEPAQPSPQAPPPPSAAAPPPPGGNDLRPKSDSSVDLAAAGDGKAVPLKNMMGFFGPPPTGASPPAPASA